MGYRIHLASISKKRIKEIENVSSTRELHLKIFPDEEIDGEYLYVGVYDIPEKTLHEFGKYIEWTPELKERFSRDVFKDKKFNDEYTEEHDFFIINKDGLIHIIEEYNKDMESYYREIYAMSFIVNTLLHREVDEGVYRIWDLSRDKLFNNSFSHDSQRHINNDLDSVLEYSEDEIKKALIYFSQIINNHLISELREYNEPRLPFFDLNMDKPETITQSWKKDKNILEMVHILKTFDFDKNEFLIYGY